MLNQKEIGFRIKQRREELGLTLEDIALYVRVARSTIQRYEAGSISRPKLPVLYSISQALRVSPDWLLGITDDPTPQGISNTTPPAPAANVVIARGRNGSFVEKKLSDEDLAALQRFIDCLPEKMDL